MGLSFALLWVLVGLTPFTAIAARRGPGIRDVPIHFVQLKSSSIPDSVPSNWISTNKSLPDGIENSLKTLLHESRTSIPTSSERIAYGEFATPNQFSYAAKLDLKRDDGNYGLCGGTLISPRVILTAAHCLHDSNGRPRVTIVSAYIGDLPYNSQSTPLTGSFYLSPGYAPTHSYNEFGDISLVLLNASSPANPVALDDGTSPLDPSDWFITLGWGRTEATGAPLTEALKWTSVPGISNADYQTWINQWSNRTGYPPLDVEVDHFPAGLESTGKDSCSGDSGGPLILPGSNFPNSRVDKDVQVGVVSYGLSPVCGGGDNIGFYTGVGYWRTWIEDSLSLYNMRGTSPPQRLSGEPSFTACLNGGELSKVNSVGSAGECCELCREKGQCFAWNWTSGTKVCSLKKQNGYKYKYGECVSAKMGLASSS